MERTLNRLPSMMRWMLRLGAYLYATIHCLMRHGAGPIEDWHQDHFALRCPVCPKVFWRE